MSLEDYQQVVHERYADKLPDSDYDESGAAGGFEPASAPVTTPGGDAPPRSGVLAGIGGIGLLGAGLLVRRRRSHT
ncbi:LPXTG cell wall anchor domain-containing protein [Janibacter anophelis]|uniref:LPXTG cell wall anchor domain-containing protein n=1 Tax=Janibacter anophelis TaxID=319054 RepID=UPI000DEF5778|nr:LPXTG cell wall anchor domain-containing protein [Janibacter anophelis]